MYQQASNSPKTAQALAQPSSRPTPAQGHYVTLSQWPWILALCTSEL